MKRKRRSKRKRQIKYGRILIALILVLGLIFAFLHLPIFNIRNIVINGNSKVESSTILATSNLTTKDNFIFIDKEEVEKRISSITFIDYAKIKRSLPLNVIIDVVERKPASTIQVSNKYFLIDKYGVVIDESDTLMLNLLLIKGIEKIDNIKLGDKIFDFASEEQNKLLNEIYDGESLFKFKNINLEENKAELVLYNDVFVAFGSYNNVEYKLKVLDQMILSIEDDTSRKASMILMEEGPDPVLVYE
ncbi:MAG: FtsQ-type POTRA domain-containing protein [Tissierellia bacterium]|jgi:hypothetical protein|nr:FtsQ-type POTRA domain-containing protein [Tissierellia bacterium]